MLMKQASIHRFTGVGVFIALLVFGLLISIPLWGSHHIFAASVIAIFGGIGVYFWQRPVDLYRCSNCSAEYYGESLSIYRR